MISNQLDVTLIKSRSEFYAQIREFFNKENFLEVETPTLSHFGSVDLNIDSYEVKTDKGIKYLTTSPEFHMKRLLVDYQKSIFQICKAYRSNESGHLHNAEFTLLEFYKVAADEFELMKVIESLIEKLLGKMNFQYKSYSEVFLQFSGINPIDSTIIELSEFCEKKSFKSNNRDELIDFIWIDQIEAKLSQYPALFIYDYPASQSALARLKEDDKRFARRFELYINGIEIGNGFNELIDAKEQEIRFIIDQQKRESKGKRYIPFDKNLIKAMELGMPECSGVAIGLDRLLMIKHNKTNINDVLAFPIELA